MRNNNLLIILTICLFLIPFISGALPQPVESGNCVNIKIPYNASSLNITTLTYPNQSFIFLNVVASLNGSTFFYNDFCDTEQTGDYTYEFVASDGFTSGNSFKVTETGDELNESQSSIYITLLIINILFLFISLYFSIKIPYGNEKKSFRGHWVIEKISIKKYFKLFSIWISYTLFLWFITLITGVVNNYIFFQPLKDMATGVYLLVNTLGYGVNVFMVVFLIIRTWKDIILNKEILEHGKAFLSEL